MISSISRPKIIERFREFAPNAQVPCLKDGSRGSGASTIWDSLAIIEYLAERHEGCWPEDGKARMWARCATAEMHGGFSALRNQCPMNVGVRARLHKIDKPLQRDIDRIGELFAQGLEQFGGPWLAGSTFSAVDAFYAPVAYRTRTFDLDIGPAGRQWVEHILASSCHAGLGSRGTGRAAIGNRDMKRKLPKPQAWSRIFASPSEPVPNFAVD